MPNDELKRFPEDFEEIGRDLENGDLLLGADGRTGNPVLIKADRITSGESSSYKVFSPATGTEYSVFTINGIQIKAEL